jgi:hypothetical protein
MDIFNEVLEAVHQRFTNPLRPIMALWDSQVGGLGAWGEIGLMECRRAVISLLRLTVLLFALG